jgi:hypothetical protein
VKLIAKLFIDQFNKAIIIVNMHYEIAIKTIEKVIPNPLVKFYTLITKSRKKKHKKMKNTNVNPSNRIAVLM